MERGGVPANRFVRTGALNQTMREIAIHLLFGFGGLLLLILTKVTIRYHITSRFLRISWMGLPIRWVRLKNIRQVMTHRVSWAERWTNTFRHSNRYLLIRKHSGLWKHLVITPRNHMVFRAELDRARGQVFSSSGQSEPSAHLAAERTRAPAFHHAVF